MEKILATPKEQQTTPKVQHLPVIHHGQVFVRRASIGDVDQVYNIACSVGKNRKDSYQGFLIDNYRSDPDYYRTMFERGIFELNHFYVAENNDVLLGFLMAHTKEQWLAKNPGWIDGIHWHPGFDMRKTENFILVDKTAVRADLTSRGIGSRLYMRLIRDIRTRGIRDMFGETVVDPVPNFASMAFRKKQNYTLAGVHYEKYNGGIVTDLVYHRSV